MRRSKFRRPCKVLIFNGARVLVAIAACHRGAEAVDAVDIDDFAFENCAENIATNGVAHLVTPLLGDSRLLEGRHYDFILANINRNILLADMDNYLKTLNPNGDILFSGFLDEDVAMMTTAATSRGLTLTETRHTNGWAALRFTRKE